MHMEEHLRKNKRHRSICIARHPKERVIDMVIYIFLPDKFLSCKSQLFFWQGVALKTEEHSHFQEHFVEKLQKTVVAIPNINH